MGKEVGGGFRMGNTCKSMAVHVNVWQKPLQYYKVISLQLIKINENKIKKIINEKKRKKNMLQGCGPGLALCVSMFFQFSALSQMIGAPDRE